jgi:hypothetical protein
MSEKISLTTRLGNGSFGAVFTWRSAFGVAIKQVLDARLHTELEEEFAVLQTTYRVCDLGNNVFKIPKPFCFYESMESLITAMGELDVLSLSDAVLSKQRINKAFSIYTMQRVNFLPFRLRSIIVSKYFPDEFKKIEHQFISRICLGRVRQPPNERFFCIDNFPLSLLSCIDIGLDTYKIAYDLGRLLFQIHFNSRMDARGVKFFVGGHSENPLIDSSCYCLDFSQARHHCNSVQRMIVAYDLNDCYYPRPLTYFNTDGYSDGEQNTITSTWNNFRSGYILEIKNVCVADGILAELFLNGISVLLPR